MDVARHMAQWLTPPPLRADLTARWQALRNWDSYSPDNSWLWIMLAVGLGALLVAGILVYLLGRRPRAKKTENAFGDRARSLGLNDAEQTVLARIAAQAGLVDTRAVFSMEEAVNQGAREILAEESGAASAPERRARLEAAVGSICQKLGFQSPLPPQVESEYGTRQIPQGSRLLVVDEDGAVSLAATVAGADDECLILIADAPLNLAPPAHVLLRHGSQGLAHEFDCALESCHDRQFRVRHAQAVRTTNLRRYVRVAVDLDVQVAEWPFFQEGRDMRIPFFVQARLTEIAGPGLLIEMPTRGALPEKLLVIVRMADRTVLQGTAAVRRQTRIDAGRSAVAVEMLDLNGQELAEMVRQTNLSARQKRDGEEPAPQPRPLRDAVAQVPQETP